MLEAHLHQLRDRASHVEHVSAGETGRGVRLAVQMVRASCWLQHVRVPHVRAVEGTVWRREEILVGRQQGGGGVARA